MNSFVLTVATWIAFGLVLPTASSASGIETKYLRNGDGGGGDEQKHQRRLGNIVLRSAKGSIREYFLYKDSWQDIHDAYNQCKANGMDLAVITSPEENALVADLCSYYTPHPDCWIGLTSWDVDLNRWTDHSTKIIYTNFRNTKPNNPAGVVMNTMPQPHVNPGEWLYISNLDSKATICSRVNVDPPPQVEARAFAGNMQYTLVTGKYHWEDARQVCQKGLGNDYTMAVISTQQEADAVTNLCSGSVGSVCWLGLTSSSTTWIDGTAVTHRSYIGAAIPADEQGVAVYGYTEPGIPLGSWLYNPLTTKRSVICSRKEAMQTTRDQDGSVCFTGTDAEVTAACSESNLNCCTGGSACAFWGGINRVCQGSCNGNDSCRSLSRDTTIHRDACNGPAACRWLGGSSPPGTSIDSASACTEGYTCASGTLGKKYVGPRSCNGQKACSHVGNEAVTFGIPDDSCVGATSCLNFGKVSTSVTPIYPASCVGDRSCENSQGVFIIANVYMPPRCGLFGLGLGCKCDECAAEWGIADNSKEIELCKRCNSRDSKYAGNYWPMCAFESDGDFSWVEDPNAKCWI